MTQENILDKFESLRAWLRMHGSFNVTLELWGLYGCYSLTVTHLSETIAIFRGKNLERRLDQALQFLMNEEEYRHATATTSTDV